jgi:L,D-peptidoglycan transpeptidase YkuD (ErfK/YbiS/YcfS/YnhG family)
VRRRRTLAVALLLAVATWVALSLAHGGPGDDAEAEQPMSATDSPGTDDASSTKGGAPARPSSRTQQPARDLDTRDRLAALAHLGPKTLATVPATARKVVVVRGDGAQAATTSIELYVTDGGTWRRAATWRGHVGARGWTTSHREGDLSTPVGTFSLTDAGGRLADPGTAMPYDHSSKFVPSGSSVFGDSLEGSFDYVIAIDYNRRTGVSPRDPVHPQGDELGGGIWLHVDHEGPTHGCVSVPREGMVALLRSLTPQDRPVVVMADAARLAA